jgi:pimeloyl-ACP methyl ester carboxylesterase
MRALEPSQTGRLTLAGFEIGFEVFGPAAAPAVLLLSPWQITHGRIWKMQTAYLARHFHVIVFDPAGNGLGERTLDAAAYDYDRMAEQAAGLLDYLDVERAAVIGLSNSCVHGLLLAARFAERVQSLVLIGSVVYVPDWPPAGDPGFWQPRATYSGWEKYNANYWREHYADFLDFFFGEVFSEPFSTKLRDDARAWGLETTPEVLIQTERAKYPALPVTEILARVRCPVLLLHGDDDHICPIANSRSLAAARPDWEFVTLAGAGHGPNARDPVRVNLLIKEFLDRTSR